MLNKNNFYRYVLKNKPYTDVFVKKNVDRKMIDICVEVGAIRKNKSIHSSRQNVIINICSFID